MGASTAWLAIVNPTSGRARSGRSWPQVAQALRQRGVVFEEVRTTAPGAGRELARRAVSDGRRHLLAVGGDGSVHDVVKGLMSVQLPPDDRVTLAPVPLGTGNDWARTLGIPRDPDGIAATVAAGRTLEHDVGQLDFGTVDGDRPSRQWFINVAGAGFDSHVIERLPTHVESPLAYLWGALRELQGYRAPRFRIQSDGGNLDERLLLAFVANGRYCGNRMHVAPQAQVDDGCFDVVAIREVGLLTALTKLAKLYRGTLHGDRLVWETRCSRLQVAADRPAAVEADGQVVGRTPVTVSLRPRALRAVCGGG